MEGSKIMAEFEAIDLDHNGFITRPELVEYVRRNRLDPEMVDVSLSDFLFFVVKHPSATTMEGDRVMTEFEAIDVDHNGFITRPELTNYVKRNKLAPDMVDVSRLDATYMFKTVKTLPLNLNRACCLNMYGAIGDEQILHDFEEIDQDHNGFITKQELQDYVKKNKLPEDTVEKWFTWFDMDGTGRITVEEVCTTLGIGMRKKYQEKVEEKRELIRKGVIAPPPNTPPQYGAPPPKLMEGVDVLHRDDVKSEVLEEAISLVRNNEDKYKKDSEFAHFLKDEMERLHGRYWHIIVASSTMGCAVGHEDKHFIHFRYKNRLYIFYRTPEPN
ncbi:unnamed protein product [Dibothriocephalus latus]|uniref:EF-hand domain-containing protein n=1 Tax=Dibothriocephalus latus TaxID=60516 RepID=A0A3P6S7K6_DIBLA|nr:unnamed protein product [Dibothriocephalus latus]